jgi:ATP-binding cassette, subfamily F, member 2
MPQRKTRPQKGAKKEQKKNKSSDNLKTLDTVFDKMKVDDGGRVATGYLLSEPRARDVKISPFSLALHGIPLVEDTLIELSHGHRYGLLGRNGCGKSTFLKCIAAREVPIPDIFDLYHLAHEAPPSDVSALDYVINSAKDEIERIDAQIEDILTSEGPESQSLIPLYERQDELDPETFESRASTILVGLGFSPVENLAEGGSHITKLTKDMSGGWRMRVALAKALFLAPSILLLDEPTNHLDLGACVWLEEYLSTYPKILVVTSHSQDFLNGVCTDMMVMQGKKLKYWAGNFDAYVKTRAEQETNQIKLYKKQQAEIADIKKFIASCGTYANLVRQAKSRQKILDKMEADGLLEMPFQDPLFRFTFPDAGELAPPLISFSEVSFSYSGKKEDYLFGNVSFGIHSNSRISLVGPNGAGKSTLIKLIVGEISACEGTVSRRAGMSIGRFNQHSHEVLDDTMTPIEHIQKKYQDKYPTNRLEEWRAVVGTYGIPKDYHLEPIGKLSDGLKTRLVFCDIALQKPHLLLLDEPTNAADMEMIDSLAEAINNFNGGVLVISHDFKLLSKCAEEIWEVDHGVKVFDGDIRDYKKGLSKTIAKRAAKLAGK